MIDVVFLRNMSFPKNKWKTVPWMVPKLRPLYRYRNLSLWNVRTIDFRKIDLIAFVIKNWDLMHLKHDKIITSRLFMPHNIFSSVCWYIIEYDWNYLFQYCQRAGGEKVIFSIKWRKIIWKFLFWHSKDV